MVMKSRRCMHVNKHIEHHVCAKSYVQLNGCIGHTIQSTFPNGRLDESNFYNKTSRLGRLFSKQFVNIKIDFKLNLTLRLSFSKEANEDIKIYQNIVSARITLLGKFKGNY